MSWQPSLGAWPEGEGTRFRVWAPEARSVQVVLERPAGASHALTNLTAAPAALPAAGHAS